MTVNTVYFEGRMGRFSLLKFSNLSPPLSCSPLLSRSSPLSLSFSLLSPVFTLLPPFPHPSSLPSFSFLPFSLSFPPFPTLPLSHSSFSRFHSPSPFFPPFLSPILLLSPVFTLLPPFSHPSYLPSFFFLPFSLSFPLFQPFLSPILLLSPPLLHLLCRPLLYTSNHVLKQPCY